MKHFYETGEFVHFDWDYTDSQTEGVLWDIMIAWGADMQISELVTVFNHQVGNTGWTGMRAYHDQALIEEFQRRGIDVSTVYDGKAITFAHPVRYNIANNRLAIVG